MAARRRSSPQGGLRGSHLVVYRRCRFDLPEEFKFLGYTNRGGTWGDFGWQWGSRGKSQGLVIIELIERINGRRPQEPIR